MKYGPVAGRVVTTSISGKPASAGARAELRHRRRADAEPHGRVHRRVARGRGLGQRRTFELEIEHASARARRGRAASGAATGVRSGTAASAATTSPAATSAGARGDVLVATAGLPAEVCLTSDHQEERDAPGPHDNSRTRS